MPTTDTDTMVYIGDLPFAAVLAALYNNTVVKGFPTRTPFDGKMPFGIAQSILIDNGLFVEEFGGRQIYVRFADYIDTTRYDSYRGVGGMSAKQIVDYVRASLKEALDAAIMDHWVRANSGT